VETENTANVKHIYMKKYIFWWALFFFTLVGVSGLPGVEGWLISVEEETTGRFLASTTGEIRNRDTRPVP
jgi:hypothetical protein